MDRGCGAYNREPNREWPPMIPLKTTLGKSAMGMFYGLSALVGLDGTAKGHSLAFLVFLIFGGLSFLMLRSAYQQYSELHRDEARMTESDPK
jgi:hypothetical protein